MITASRLAISKYHLERFLKFLSPISCHSCRAIHGHVAMSAIEYFSPARYFEFYAGAADKIHGEVIPTQFGFNSFTKSKSCHNEVMDERCLFVRFDNFIPLYEI